MNSGEGVLTTRILFVEGNTDGTVGGSYYLLLDLIRSLDRERFEPIVAFHRGNFLEESFRACGAQVFIFPRATPFQFPGNLLNKLLWPIKAVINLYRRLPRSALERARFMRAQGVDLVNLSNSITSNHDWMIAARIARTPCLKHEMGISSRYSLLSRFLGKRLEAIICLSHAIRDTMVARGVSPANTRVIHCGIDLTRYRQIESPADIRARHGIPMNAPVTGVVGNIRKWKGQETIVRAMVMLKARHPGIRCLLVGGATPHDPSYWKFLERLCQDLGVADDVIFAGFQRNAIDYMRAMDVVCHTSTSPEPFGLVTLEAMSLAKPLVSTTIGGPAEVVVQGMTGLLVEPGKPELLADAVHSLLEDPARAAEMGRRGYEHLQEKFSLASSVAQTVRVYDEIMARQHKPRG